MDQLAVHSLIAIFGLRRLFRKYLLTVTGMLSIISCFFWVSLLGMMSSSCLLAKIAFFDLCHSLTVLTALDLKNELVV